MVNSRVSEDRSAFKTNRHLSLYQSTRRNFPEDLNIRALSVYCAVGALLLNILGLVRKIARID
jgi:hypothetical protein